jgi:transcriptional regulator with XRE-family HTH domain
MNTTIQVPPRQRLVDERIRRRWTQLEVADRLGTTPGNVSRWERGITSPGPYFRSKLCELFGSSAQELGLTWDESDDVLSHHTQASVLAASFQRNVSPRSNPSFTGHEDLLALLHTLIRPDSTTPLSSLSANSGLGELNLPEQESWDQGRLAQTVEEWLQTGLNRVLIPVNAGAVVLVVLNSNVCSRPSSLQKRLYSRQITRRDNCCDEYPTMQGTLCQQQGA